MSGKLASYADVHRLLRGEPGPRSEAYSVQDQLTLSWGFLSHGTQRAAFPASHSAWDELNRDLPRLMANLQVRSALERFPTLDASPASLSDEYLGRASSFLGYAVHAAFADYQSSQPIGTAVTLSTFVTPGCIEEPWRQVMGRLHRPCIGMTLADYCHGNVRQVDESRAPVARNLDSDIGITGTPTERVSQASVAAVEYAAHWCLEGIDAIYVQKQRLMGLATEADDGALPIRASLRRAVATITSGLLEMSRALQALDVFRAPPALWNIGGALWCPTRPGEKGFDGTGAPSFGLLDAFFGRGRFDSELGKMTREQFTRRIPEFQRDVLLAVQNEDFPAFLRQASARWPEEGDFGWTRCLQEYQALLRTHLRKVFAYLEVGRMVTGRDTTNGELHKQLSGHAPSVPDPVVAGAIAPDFYDVFERATRERGTPADLTWTATAVSEQVGHDVFRVRLTIPPGEPPLYAFPGDHVEVSLPHTHPQAPEGTVRRFSLSTIASDGRSASLTVARRGPGSRFVVGELGVPSRLRFRVAPSSLRVPADPGAPVALIAGGVGVSPFVGFLESRAAAAPPARGRTMVFLSARTPEHWPLREEIIAWAQAGVIELFVGFTRQSPHIPIATTLRGQEGALRSILEDVEGHVFVCGPAGFCLSVQAELDAIAQRHFATRVPVNARVQYEAFGPPTSSTGRVARQTAPASPPLPLPQPGEQDVAGVRPDRTPELRVLGWPEVRRHNHRDSAWLVIDDDVYDITAYLKHHPGSAELLLIYAGRDATKAFQFAHAPQPSVKALLAEMRIGRVTTSLPEASGLLADSALRTLNSATLLDDLARSVALVKDDDLALRPWRARVVATAWLGHIQDGVLPLLRACRPFDRSLHASAPLAAAMEDAESALNTVLILALAHRYDEAQRALQALTLPILDWLRKVALGEGKPALSAEIPSDIREATDHVVSKVRSRAVGPIDGTEGSN